jgi:hypothetical protein
MITPTGQCFAREGERGVRDIKAACGQGAIIGQFGGQGE